MSAPCPILLWFRTDLRLEDHPALRAAATTERPVIPVFLWAPDEESPWVPGAASRWWLHQSLTALETRLKLLGSRLVLRTGPTLPAWRQLLRETGARTVFWTERFEPRVRLRDDALAQALRQEGIEVRIFPGPLLFAPDQIRNQSGRPFQVFTPFWRHCLRQAAPEAPAPAPRSLPGPRKWPATLALRELELEPRVDWTTGFRAVWIPGEAGARKRLDRFVRGPLRRYNTDREIPAIEGTSRLSPHLHFGEISPRQVWHAVHQRVATTQQPRPDQAASGRPGPGAALEPPGARFLTELGWREFAHHLLHHFPHTPEAPLRAEFARFPWRQEAAWLKAWQQGRTGLPLVDAGLRELWATGWMHNRVRMVTASFLVKHLLLDWQEGARWFWNTLVDADLASNTLGWQWTAGCGADAAPFFRVFNPVSQGEKFDAEAAYIRRWVPELARLPAPWIHQPWKASPALLRDAGLVLGRHYPGPIVSLTLSRATALDAYARMRRSVS